MRGRFLIILITCCLTACTSSALSTEPGAPSLTNASSPYAYSVIYRFPGGSKGASPGGGLAIGSNGAYMGVTQFGGSTATGCRGLGGCGVVYALKAASNGSFSETVAYRFQGEKTSDGQYPLGPLIVGPKAVYGVTSGGGTGRGTVFKLTRTSTGKLLEHILYRFSGKVDGDHPSGLYQQSAQTLFGTTVTGGDEGCGYNLSRQFGCGTVFELSNTGKKYHEKTVLAFGFTNGASPRDTVVGDGNGHLFGTSPFGPIYEGSASSCSSSSYGCTGFGLIYEATGLGVLYAFQDKDDGAYPNGSLLIGTDGALYGTASNGGKTTCSHGCGTVFKLTPSGGKYLETTLYEFLGTPDGNTPYSTLIAGASGALYGTTYGGGDKNCECGTVFELIPSSSGYSERVLHSFSGGSDGAFPNKELLVDKSGFLYGTTQTGGNGPCRQGCGTVFRLHP